MPSPLLPHVGQELQPMCVGRSGDPSGEAVVGGDHLALRHDGAGQVQGVVGRVLQLHHELLLIPPRLRRPALVCQVVQAAEEEALRASERLAERIGRLQRLIRALENNHPPHPPAAGAWRHTA